MASVNYRTLIPYRIRTVQIGFEGTALVLLVLAPLMLVGDEKIPLIPVMALLLLTAIGALVTVKLPWERLFAGKGAMPLLYLWSIADIAMITSFLAIVGPDRPNYFLLYTFTTIFFAATYPVRTQVLLFIFTAASYLIVWAAFAGDEPFSRALFRVVALGIVAFMASFLSRELMQQMAAHNAARAEADKRAALIQTVAAAARDMSVLGPGAVLDAVVDATDELGFDAAEICNLDEGSGEYEVIRARGLPEDYVSRRHNAARGVVGLVMQERQTVVVDDYSALSDGVEGLRRSGFRAVIGSKIEVHGRVAAILVAGTHSERRVAQEDVEAFELLASQASRALQVATEFEELKRAEEDLRRSRAELEREKIFHESLVQAQSDLREGVCVVDLTTQRFEFVNDAYCEMHGYTRDELMNLPSFFELMAPEEEERLAPRVEARLRGVRTSDHEEVNAIRKDGTRFRVETAHKPLDDKRLVVLVRDITERWQWAHGMERSLSLLKATLESTADGILVVDLEGRMSAFNEKFVEMWRLPRDVVASGDDSRAIEMVLDQLKDPDAFLDKVKALYVSDQQSFDVLEFKDGRTFERHSQPQRLGGTDGEIVGRVWSFRDVTARRAAARAIEQANAALVRADREKRRLLTHLVRAKEEERKRVASDIHDDSIQVMTSVAIGLERLVKQIEDPEKKKMVARLEDVARAAVSRLRTMVFELRPPTLDEEGLASALRLHLEEFQLDTGISYTFRSELTQEPPVSYRTALYRIAQEALTNVRKHSHASTVTVSLKEDDDGIRLCIEDNGAGLPAVDVVTLRHIGIPEMRERAEILGGRLEVRSRPGRGTTVDVWMPNPHRALAGPIPDSSVV